MQDEERRETPPESPAEGNVPASPSGEPGEQPGGGPWVAGSDETPQSTGARAYDLPETGEDAGRVPAPEPPLIGSAAETSAAGEAGAYTLTTPPSGPQAPARDESTVSDDDRLMAALAWVSLVILQIPLVSLVLLLAEWNKTRPFQRYHAIASIIFWVVAVIYEMVAGVAFTLLTILSAGCLAICLWVIFFLPHVVALWFALQAYQGRYTQIPFISDLMRDQRWA